MCHVWARAGRDVPELGVVRIDRDRPRVVPIPPFVRGVPSVAAVVTPRRPASAGLVGPLGDAWMPGERVDVRLGAWTVVVPAFAAISRSHQAAELDPD